jgi:hypothetical protein
MSVIYRAFTGLAALSAASTAAIDLAAFAAAGGDLAPPRCACPDQRSCSIAADTPAELLSAPTLQEGAGRGDGSTAKDPHEATLVSFDSEL